jgi:four helix bundle protein
MVKTFRDLIAWQKAMELAREVYQATKSMPEAERFGLTSQMRRAAVSTPSNIAEGHGRESRTDYLRFLRIARGSLMELQTQLILAEQLNLLQISQTLHSLQAETDRVLQGLIRSLETMKRK